MKFDFTIGIFPDSNNVNIAKDLRYIRSILLYADKVRLINPVAHILFMLADEKNYKNQKTIVKLMNLIMPFIKAASLEKADEFKPFLNHFEEFIHSKQYASLPFMEKHKMLRDTMGYALQIRSTIISLAGESQYKELEELSNKGLVVVEKIDSVFGDADRFPYEFYEKLMASINSSHALLDDECNKLLGTALSSRTIQLTNIEKQKMVHAGLASNYLQQLPSFEEVPIDELFDIRNDLQKYLVNFRSKMLKYSSDIKSMPWNNDFATECQLLYIKEVAPAINELEAATKENSFVKNLGKQFLGDQNVWKISGGLGISIAATGAIETMSNIIASEISSLLGAGAAVALSPVIGQKIYKAYSETEEQRKNLQRNDLYFYYEARNRLRSGN